MSKSTRNDLESARIGRRLAKLRRQRGVSTTELARRVGISQPQISRLENGKQGFRSETLIKISEALGVRAGYFFLDEADCIRADHKEVSSERSRIGSDVAKNIKRQFGEVAVTPNFRRVLKRLATTLAREDSDTRTLRQVLDKVLKMNDTQREALLSSIESSKELR